MLKITYTDTGLLLEQISQSLESLVTQRTVLALRLGQPIAVQSTAASLPLPADLPGLGQLLHLAQKTGALAVEGCDRNWLEVTFSGVWIAESSHSDEGIFIAELEPTLERQLLALWHQSQRHGTPSRSVPKTLT